jgi:DNA polymerase III subunit epsilon
MALQLKRPLAFIDLETTGISVNKDKIIEIAIVKIVPGHDEPLRLRKFINPQMPIPPQSSAIHGITDEMVKDCPSFRLVANEIKQFLEDCDLAGYNSNRFDIPLLIEEFLRVGIDIDTEEIELLDVQRIFHLMEPRNLSAAYKFYCAKDLENAHSAEADVFATWEILQAQMERYPNLGDSITDIQKIIGKEELVDFARRFIYDDGVIVFNFGKHKGKPVTTVLKNEPQYYDWMLRSDFELHTKKKLTEIFNNMMLKK